MASHRLIITEKPSVGRSLSDVLGAKNRKDGYFEGSGYMVSWCIGHLVELAPADAYDEKYAKWCKEDLPIIPRDWQYTVPKDKQKQLGILRKLMNDKNVESIICATDAGREGELIFRLVYNYCGCTKPIERLWISSMEDEAIRQGMANLKNGAEYDNLYQSALCRSQADWLVGINATRLFSALCGQTLNIGRVMTPTLAILANRETEIQSFQSQPFYTSMIDCGEFTASGEKLQNMGEAQEIVNQCNGAAATIVTIERQKKTISPPKLYDLTSLQRDANRLLGYTAQQTLDYLQSLYEKKLTTYPRTDSQYLTNDMADSVKSIIHALAGILPFAQDNSFSPDIGRVLNSKKVSDHHAVIPTMESMKGKIDDLPGPEKAVWMLVANRLLCAVADSHEYESISVTLDCAGNNFTAKGKTILHDGWKALDSGFLSTLKEKPKKDGEETALPEMQESQTFASVAASVKEGKTTPPKRFTEDTLLSAMETAGSGDMPDEAERKGLGTPATRAGTIEKLVKTGFVERQKKNMVPTEKGMNLITVLPDVVKSPLLTAEWESSLLQVEKGDMQPEAFMGGISGLLDVLIQTSQVSEEHKALFLSNNSGKVVGSCPRCGTEVREGNKGFFCDNRDCAFVLWKDNKFFSSKKKKLDSKTAAALLNEGRIFMSGLFSKKTGKTYDATIILDDTGGKYVNFRLEFEKKGDKDA